jgi:hypothetical protein
MNYAWGVLKERAVFISFGGDAFQVDSRRAPGNKNSVEIRPLNFGMVFCHDV